MFSNMDFTLLIPWIGDYNFLSPELTSSTAP